MSECQFLPDRDKKFWARARLATDYDIDSDPDTDELSQLMVKQIVTESDRADDKPVVYTDTCEVRRVQIKDSPHLNMYVQNTPVHVTLDCGATGNLISSDAARRIGASIIKTSQGARQADGSSPLDIIGETRFSLTLDGQNFHFEGLVANNLDGDLLGGVPFMVHNDIAIRPAKHEITLSDNHTIQYPDSRSQTPAAVRAVILRGQSNSVTVWPGEYFDVNVPTATGLPRDQSYILEPRGESKSPVNAGPSWPPTGVYQSVGHSIKIPNDTSYPLIVKKNAHFCQVREVTCSKPDTCDAFGEKPAPAPPIPQRKQSPEEYKMVKVDPDCLLSPAERQAFMDVNSEFRAVFSTKDKLYNGHSGPIEGVVNMGPVLPPQRKGKLPLYGRGRLEELQAKFDDLEREGVFARPEDVGVCVEYLNPSFLVNKPGGGTRLVTAFAEVGRYCKPQPSLMPDVDSTLRIIAGWEYLIQTDLKSAFFQIPLSKDSMKFCGVATPFRGIRVYQRCAMGMPGSETTLEELMCRILGQLLLEGVAAKIADDIYIGGGSPADLLRSWRRFVQVLADNNLGISAPKTVIAPAVSTVLGWVWKRGMLSATSHRISTIASCEHPKTVKGMRSFIGAYKFISRVMPQCSSVLAPLDSAIAGLESKDKIMWTPELEYAFQTAQSRIKSTKSITLPRRSDQLWLVTDAATRPVGLAATLYITRADKLHVAGYFSAKLRTNQVSWLPCEVEALAITAAVKHFSPYIIQSDLQTCILTDSKPCVQAAEKLCRGEFSASPRVATFLSAVGRYHVSIRHLAGSANVPSDFGSRNAPECSQERCSVCNFVTSALTISVLRTSVSDVLSGACRLPYASRAAWHDIQSSCPDLRRTHSHLIQGTRPSKKITNIANVKRYLRVVTIATDGLLVVRQQEALSGTRETIVVPQQVLHGLVMALHLQLDHPSANQLRAVMRRSFYALDLDACVKATTENCHQCAALRQVPRTIQEQSTQEPPPTIGVSFAADVIRRQRQLILLIRETVTSYTVACMIPNEQHVTLRDAIVVLMSSFVPLEGPPAVIRCDPAPGFQALTRDPTLAAHRISIEIGRIKNCNKNPVAERAIQELEGEILRQDPLGGALIGITLSLAVSRLNKRIRSRGMSSWEMYCQRDMFTGNQLPVDDIRMTDAQYQLRVGNHVHSELSKAPLARPSPEADLAVGDIVYIKSDLNKNRSRDRYLVTSVDGPWCDVKKFAGGQLRAKPYRIKRTECFKVLSDVVMSTADFDADEDGDSQNEPPITFTPPASPVAPVPSCEPPPLPDIPPDIFIPPGELAFEPDIGNHSGDILQSEGSPAASSAAESRVEPAGGPRRSQRVSRPAVKMQDYVTDMSAIEKL